MAISKISTTSLVRQHILWRGLYFLSVLLINIGIARFFEAEKSGQLFFIVNNLALILLIVSISLESGSTFYISSGKVEAGLMANFSLVWATGASLAALGGWWLVLYFSRPDYLSDPAFLLSSFFFILGVLFTTYFTALFYAKKDFGLPNKVLFGVNTGMVVLLIAGKNNSLFRSNFIEVYFFSFFLQGMILRILFFRKYASKENRMLPPPGILKKVLRYSLVALIANLIYFLVNRIDYWFVQHYCSAGDLGNYIQASKMAQLLFILPAILGSTLFPIFSSPDKSSNENQLALVIRILLWINGGICLLIALVGWYIIPLVFGSSFNHMYLLFLFLIPGILSTTMNYPMTAWFSASKRIDTNIQGSILALIVICIGDLLVLPSYGIMAAPVISSAGYFCYYCYTIYIFRKEHDIRLTEFLFLKKSDLNRILKPLRKDFTEPVPENPII